MGRVGDVQVHRRGRTEEGTGEGNTDERSSWEGTPGARHGRLRALREGLYDVRNMAEEAHSGLDSPGYDQDSAQRTVVPEEWHYSQACSQN